MSDRHPHTSWSPSFLVVCLLYVVVGSLIYANSFDAPFHFDDKLNIVENPHIRVTALTPEQLGGVLESPNSKRVLPLFSFALNYYVGEYHVFGYHLVNVTIHLLNGILLYLLIRVTLGIRPREPSDRLHSLASYRSAIAMFAGLIWLVHPLHTQSVTYILQRMNSMAALWVLLSLLCYVIGRNQQRSDGQRRQAPSKATPRRAYAWFLGCSISAVLAMASKENAATLPFFLILYEWYFYQEARWRWLRQQGVWLAGAIVAFVAVSLIYTDGNPIRSILYTYQGRDFTVVERVLTEWRVALHYISLFVYPHPSRLHLDYDYVLSTSLFEPLTTLAALITILVLLRLAFWLAQKGERLLAFGILWFLGNLVIESSILGFELVYEHRTYLPSMFLPVILVVLAFRLIKHEWIRVGVLGLIVGLLSVATVQRNAVWGNEIVFWTHEAQASPHSARAHSNLGNLLMNEGRGAEAVIHLREALQADPNFAPAHYNLGIVLERQGKVTEAAEQYQQTVDLDREHAGAHNNLGNLLDARGEHERAIIHYRDAIRASPKYAEAHYNLAVTLAQHGKGDEAAEHFREVRRLKPSLLAGSEPPPIVATQDAQNTIPESAEKAFRRGGQLAQEGKLDAAIEQYRNVVKATPSFAKAHSNLAVLLHQKGELDQAIVHYQETIRLNPDFAEAHNNLGHILYTQGKLDKAITHYQEALRWKPDFKHARSNLTDALTQCDAK